MHVIGDYFFDATRMIFYRKEYTSSQIDLINSKIIRNDCFDKLINVLDKWKHTEHRSRMLINEIGICLTYDCNLRCNYCSDSSIECNNDILNEEMISTFVSQAFREKLINRHLNDNDDSPLKVYLTGGGEPCYHWDKLIYTVDCIKNASKKYGIECKIGLTTNAIIDASQADYIAHNFDSVMVSYDGNPDIQRKNRRSPYGIDTSSYAEKTIDILCQSNNDVTVRTTIWQDDFHHLHDMADFLYNQYPHIAEWSIRPVIPAGRSYKRISEDATSLKNANFYTAYKDICDYVSNTYGKTNISSPIFPFDVNEFSCGALSPICDCPWLMPDGSIITCIEADQNKTVIGEIHNNKILWHHTYEDKLLDMYTKKFEECFDCIAYRFCKGGCPIRHLRNEKVHTDMGDWECDMIKLHITDMLSAIIEGNTTYGWKVIKSSITDNSNIVEVFHLVK